MTPETRVYAELNDIVSLEVRCSHCGTRLSSGLERFDRFSKECPNCKENWFSDDSNDLAVIREFVTRLKTLQMRSSITSLLRVELRPSVSRTSELEP